MLPRRAYIGIDIGASSIKIVEFKKVGKDLEIVHAHQSEIPREEAVNLQKDFSPIAVIIRHMLLQMGIEKSSAIVSLPNQFTFSRFIKLPPVMSSKIGQIIEYEAQQQVPFPIDSVVWDYQILEQQTLAIETEVVLSALGKRILNSFLTPMTNVVDVEAIDVGGLAFYNYVHYKPSGEGIVFIDIGAATTTLLVYEGKKFWSRNLPLAGNEITETIKNEMRISFKEAEQMKIDQGLTEEESGTSGKVNRSITITLQRLIAEIQRSIGYYRSQSKEVVIEKVVVSGGGANLKGIMAFIEKNIGIPTQKIDLLENISVSPKGTINKTEGLDPAFGIACGLALRAIGKAELNTNLLPQEVIQTRGIKKRQGHFYAAAGLFCLTLAVIYLGVSFQTTQLETKTNQIELIVSECEECYQLRAGIDEKLGPLESRLEEVRVLLNHKHDWLNTLARVTRHIPNNFWLDEFIPVQKMKGEAEALDQRPRARGRRQAESRGQPEGKGFSLGDRELFFKQFQIRGKTKGDFSDVEDFKNTLAQDSYFTKVEVVVAVQDSLGELIEFTIYVEFGDLS